MVANGIKACAFLTFFAIHQETIIDVFCIFPPDEYIIMKRKI